MKQTFSGVDILRFGLAIYLMVFHTIGAYLGSQRMPFHELLGLGGFATSTFFLLSGFILSHVYFGAASGALRGGARTFFVKRLATLYPTHLISLAFFIAVALATHQDINRFMLSSMEGDPVRVVTLTPLETAFNMLLTLSLLHAWNPLYVQINPPSWSLSALFFFYLVFPLLAPRLLAMQRKLHFAVLLWVIYLIPPIVASSLHWYSPVGVGIVTTWPLMRLPEFMIGILLYGLYRDGVLQRFTASRQWVWALLAFAALGFALASGLQAHGPRFWAYVIHNGGLLPAELALLVACLACRALPGGVTKLAARLGNAALSIFAIHLPLFLVFVRVQKLMAVDMTPAACLHDLGACLASAKLATPALGGYPLYLLATVMMAVVFQERVVTPVRDRIRRRLLAPRVHAEVSRVGL
ncbi:acyltransferase family protein [Burkholderia gladioli]|uniref:acyltransferase family protein n=1 Tax=Burkholderia gladioli TaxID=28095 RepID=UPI00163EEC22|nr:acyltransferase [Burkholderia gladioli]